MEDNKKNDIEHIKLNADFIRELLIPLATYVENISDMKKVFSELAKNLNMDHINLYKIDKDKYEVLCSYSEKSSHLHKIGKLMGNINLLISSRT